MSELLEVKVGKSFSDIKRIAKLHFQESISEIPDGFSSEEFKELKHSFIRELSIYLGKDIAGKPLIVTGHQPEFHHPGIVWKDFLAHRIASDIGGEALHLSVDTDELEIGLYYPIAYSGNEFVKKHFLIS